MMQLSAGLCLWCENLSLKKSRGKAKPRQAANLLPNEYGGKNEEGVSGGIFNVSLL
jgi:hypothetical protein